MRVSWPKAIQRLLDKYSGMKHPLEYRNNYQLVVMVILSGQSSDKQINELAPAFFKVLPNMKTLAMASEEVLISHLKKVRNHRNKVSWILQIAQQLKKDSNIPRSLEELVELPGIGRKSAHVILRETGQPAEGIMVDIHTVRVAPRLGIVESTDPKRIEQDLMEILPQTQWDAGMCMSFHGREICRPKPLCEACFMKDVCEYYRTVVKKS